MHDCSISFIDDSVALPVLNFERAISESLNAHFVPFTFHFRISISLPSQAFPNEGVPAARIHMQPLCVGVRLEVVSSVIQFISSIKGDEVSTRPVASTGDTEESPRHHEEPPNSEDERVPLIYYNHPTALVLHLNITGIVARLIMNSHLVEMKLQSIALQYYFSATRLEANVRALLQLSIRSEHFAALIITPSAVNVDVTRLIHSLGGQLRAVVRCERLHCNFSDTLLRESHHLFREIQSFSSSLPFLNEFTRRKGTEYSLTSSSASHFPKRDHYSGVIRHDLSSKYFGEFRVEDGSMNAVEAGAVYVHLETSTALALTWSYCGAVRLLQVNLSALRENTMISNTSVTLEVLFMKDEEPVSLCTVTLSDALKLDLDSFDGFSSAWRIVITSSNDVFALFTVLLYY